MSRFRLLGMVALLALQIGSAQAPDSSRSGGRKDVGYRIDEPGTITFTVGVKIVGKVEKPEVVIFLPKEKPRYRAIDFAHSFKQDLAVPLRHTPVLEP